MEGIIKAGGRDIRVKNTASALYIYKAQFGRDFLADVQRMRSDDAVDVLDVMGVVWAMAKNADKSVEGFIEWIDGFGMTDFAGEGTIKAVMDFVGGSLAVDRKNE